MNIYLSKPEERMTAWVRMHPILLATGRTQRLGFSLEQAQRLKHELERAIKELEDELAQGRNE